MSALSTALGSLEQVPWQFWLAPAGGLVALLVAISFNRSVLARSEGDENMVRIAAAVRAGAMAYLSAQYRVVAVVFVLLIGFLGLMWFLGLQPALSMIGVPVAGLLSGLCGYFGMRMATNASARTAEAAKQSLSDGLTVAFRSGAVMGLNVVGFALLDVSAWFIVLNALGYGGNDIQLMTAIMLSFALGASTQALFARVGGGIYTKAADVGADLVGKVEAGIPEDDARNPATIADNVGDNVGDVAGMGADLYESYYGSLLSSMALGTAAAFTVMNLGEGGSTALAFKLAAAPLALAGLGIFASVAGIFTVRARENATMGDLLKSLQGGVWAASALIVLAMGALLWSLFGSTQELAAAGTTWWGLLASIGSGLLAGLIIAKATEYFTAYDYRPTKSIAEQGLTGPATVIIGGIAEGMKSTWAALLTVVVAIIASFSFAGGNENFLMGLYGVAIAAVGMLSTLGITLATDAYGPIADNAGGNAEMTHQPPFVRERTDKLDALGNTTAAVGKGFAIGSAALTGLALFAAYVQVVQTQLASQATSFVEARTQEGPTSLHAVYMGDNRFAIVDPTRMDSKNRPAVDAGLIVDRVQLAGLHWGEAIKPGQTFTDVKPLARFGATMSAAPTAATSRRFEIRGELPHGDHAHAFDIEVIGIRNGTLGDIVNFYNVSLTSPRVIGGLFIGVLLTFLFCALTMSAVGRAAYAMMRECRRQFGAIREALRGKGMSDQQAADPDNWPMDGIDHQGKRYPDYAQCVAISTAGAQREMVVPSVLAISVPIAVGLVLGVPGVMGMLAGGLTAGFAVAVFMANAGGAWDNAKKFVESIGRVTAEDMVKGIGNAPKVPEAVRDAILAKAKELVATGNGKAMVYGKGSDDHKATVVGDTVGDPFKDTSGPSLNILIKLISIVSVVFAGLIVKYSPVVGELIGLK